MNFKSLFFLCLVGCSFSQQQTVSVHSSELEIFSFHKGYTLWKEQLEPMGLPCDLEQVINGLRAAHRGEELPIAEEELASFMRKFRENQLAIQVRENLAEAEFFLQRIAKEPEAVELVPSQLYYKQTKRGEGRFVTADDIPFIVYSAKTIKAGVEEEIFSPGTDPIPISFLDTIPGFAQGVLGMVEGEQRTLYIHPDLAYGSYGGGMTPPNSLIIIDVCVTNIAPSPHLIP
jgi:FKBP-type peptidyl-prolyl cis-trans isomerase